MGATFIIPYQGINLLQKHTKTPKKEEFAKICENFWHNTNKNYYFWTIYTETPFNNLSYGIFKIRQDVNDELRRVAPSRDIAYQ